MTTFAGNASTDENDKPTLIGVSSVDGKTPVKVAVDPTTGRVLTDSAAGSGVTSINSDTTAAQTLAVGTSGTDFAISDSGTGTHTFNLPTASHTNRGALSSADWDTFNAKQASGNYITALTGDVTASGPGSVAATLASVISAAGPIGSATATPIITYDAKGRLTTVTSATITPAVGSITGLGTGVATALAINIGSAGAPVTFNGALGTPSSGTATNITGLPAAAVLAGTLGTGAYVMDTKLTVPQVINTNNAIAASSNAATVPITAKLNTVTNSSAATLTITMTTTSAVDGQTTIVRILDFSAVAQTITWVNTENSTVTAPVTSNGSTTLPLTVGFMYNSGTSKWRCIASA